MADELDAAIVAARTEREAAKEQADHWVRRVELLDVRLDALEQAAKLRPVRTELGFGHFRAAVGPESLVIEPGTFG